MAPWSKRTACAASARSIPDGVIHRFDEVGSTMDEARALASAGASHGTAVIARLQTGGRGRNGRVWQSPPGNLHATVVLRPVAASRAPELGFVVAVALAETVDTLLGPKAALKWPNDVLVGGAKLAGILLEASAGSVVLAGIGMNVAHRPDDMPYPVTSLHALGCTASPEAVLDLLLTRLDAEWTAYQTDGFGPVLARWRFRGPKSGDPLRVRLGADIVSGAFTGLGPDGTLRLQTPDGPRTLVAGDVLL